MLQFRNTYWIYLTYGLGIVIMLENAGFLSLRNYKAGLYRL